MTINCIKIGLTQQCHILATGGRSGNRCCNGQYTNITDVDVQTTASGQGKGCLALCNLQANS